MSIEKLSKSLVADVKAILEGKKLDPVGKADKDIDNDGDVDSSDEYLHKRRQAIKKAMADEGNKFTGALMAAKKNGDKSFKVGDKEFDVKEAEEVEKEVEKKKEIKEIEKDKEKLHSMKKR
tara:strand:+ start:389 stop:751 length:363 start_codon:yes stop_codon:yes gene_type:complete